MKLNCVYFYLIGNSRDNIEAINYSSEWLHIELSSLVSSALDRQFYLNVYRLFIDYLLLWWDDSISSIFAGS